MSININSLDKPVLFVGIGNKYSGDDGIGPEVIKKLKEADLPLNAIDCGDLPENHFRDMARFKPKSVVFVDAVAMNKAPGSYDLFESSQIQNFTVSTHGISLGMLAEYLNTELGAKVYLLGIQPKNLKGEGLSEEASAGVTKVVEILSQNKL